MNILLGFVLLGFGAMVIYASFIDADWFFERDRAQSTIAIFGRDGARVIYGLCGFMFIGVGILAFVKA